MPSKYVPPTPDQTPAPQEDYIDKILNMVGLGKKSKTSTPPVDSPTSQDLLKGGPSAALHKPEADSYSTKTDMLRHGAATVSRIGGPMAGATLGTMVAPGPGTIAGGAAGGAIGEGLAELLEPGQHELSPGRIGVSGALGAVPGSWMLKAGKPVASAAMGAGLGYVGNAGYKIADGEEPRRALDPRTWSKAELAFGPLLGGAVGAGMSKLHTPPPPAFSPDKMGTFQTELQRSLENPVPSSGMSDVTRVNQNANPGETVVSAAPNGVRVGADIPRVRKPGGLMVWDDKGTGLGPEVPKVAEVKSNVRAATIGKDDLVKDMDTGIAQARDVSKANRGVNETTRKAENKLLAKEQTADLQNTRETMGGTSLGKIKQGEAKAETANYNAEQASAAEDLRLQEEQLAQADKARKATVKDLNEGFKANADANKGLIKAGETKEAYFKRIEDEENAATAAELATREKNALQEGKNLNARDKYNAKATEDQLAQDKIDKALDGMVPDEPVVKETSKLKVPGGQQSVSQTFRKPTPDADGAAPAGPPPTIVTKGKGLTREYVEKTLFTNREDANTAGMGTGASHVERIGRGKYRVVYNDGVPPAGEPPIELPPDSVGAPKSPKGKGPSGSSPAGFTPEDTERALRTKFRGRVKAQTVADALGMEVHQDGPAQFSLRRKGGEVVPEITDYTSGNVPTVDVEPPAAKPVSSVDLIAEGDKKLEAPPPAKSSGPVPPNARQLRDMEAMEQRSADNRRAAGLAPKPVEESLLDQFNAERAKKGLAPLNNLMEELPPVEPQINDRGEAEPTLPGVAPVINPEAKPVADLPLTLDGGSAKSAKFAEAENGSLGLDQLAEVHENGELPKDLNPIPNTGPELSDAELTNARTKLAAQKSQPSDKVAFAKANFSPEANAKLDELGAEYRSTTDKVRKRVLGAEMQALDKSERTRLAQDLKAPEIPVEAPPSQTPIEPTSNDLASMSPEEQSKTLADLVKKFKDQKGAISPEVLVRVGLGSAGALAGAAATPDDPFLGALMGAGAGAFAPTIARAMINRASQNPNLSPTTLGEVAKNIEDKVMTFGRMLPDYQRFALLAHPINLPVNMWVGPYGAAVMASIEHAFLGDPKGMNALRLLLNPKNFPREWLSSLPEAGSLITSAEERTEGAMGKAGPKWFRTLTEMPGKGMTAGDVASRNLLVRAGFRPEEARTITLTSDPYSPLGQGVSKFKKGAMTEGGKRSWLVNMALPFYRTSMNQLEQGMERTPIVGMMWNKLAKDVPSKANVQFVQQTMGLGVGGVSYLLGTVSNDSSDKIVRKFIGDFGGQYGTIASAAFLMGVAARQGKSQVRALGGSLVNSTPMPSLDVVTNTAKAVEKLGNGASFGMGKNDVQLPFKVIPGYLDPDVPLSLTNAVRGLATGPSPTQPNARLRPNSRYSPPTKR